MKHLFLFILVGLLLLPSCSPETKKFEGYVPKDEKVTYIWTKGEYPSEDYYLKQTVKVVIGTDTTMAILPDHSDWRGSILLNYKDNYPPAIGKDIYVEGYYDNIDNLPHIAIARVSEK